MIGRFKLLTAILGLYAALSGCSVDKLGEPGLEGPLPPAVIDTAVRGAQLASQVNQAKELALNTTIILKTLGSMGINVMMSNPSLNFPAPVSCEDYGEYTYSGTVSESGSYSLTITCKLCRTGGFQFDGTFSVTGTTQNLVVKAGSNSSQFRVVDFEGSNYATIVGTLATPGLQFSMSGISSGSDSIYDFSSDGQLTAFDYVMLGEFSVSLLDFRTSYSSSVDAVTKNKTTSVVANGRARQSWGSSLSLTYTDFLITKTEYFLSGPPPVYSGSDTEIAGSISFDFNPDGYGNQGLVSVATSTVNPIHHSYLSGRTTSGAMTLTGLGTAAVDFNSGGGIGITVSGAQLSYQNEYYLNNLINIYGVEQALPAYLGVAGAGSSIQATGSTWPATMTVTALSAGPDLNCYTDVHVLHFSPSDLSARLITWYVDWAINLVESCKPPLGIPFEEARDVTGDDFCDAGLDINGSAYDITSGGIEHFTATYLPEGYYVVAINNYSCGTDTTNMASIMVGDYLFGNYQCSYTDADGDGSSPGAWCRLADLNVNGDGTFQVLVPDLAIDPWH